MKKIISVIIAAALVAVSVLCFASCSNKEKKPVLNVYTNAGFAPYEYLDAQGNVVGVDIDVIKYIGDKLGYEVVINDIEFNQVLAEVAKDKFAVGASGMSKKPDRDQVALASNVYATSVQYVIAPKGAFTGDVVKLEDAVAYAAAQANKGIGVQKGTTGADMVAGAAEGTEAAIFEYSNAIVASQDIGTTVSAVVIDKMPAQAICADNADLECWSLDAEPESYVMYFNLEATELVAQVNEILDKMIADGLVDQYTVNHSK